MKNEITKQSATVYVNRLNSKRKWDAAVRLLSKYGVIINNPEYDPNNGQALWVDDNEANARSADLGYSNRIDAEGKDWQAKVEEKFSNLKEIAIIHDEEVRFRASGAVRVACQLVPFHVLEWVYNKAKQTKKESKVAMITKTYSCDNEECGKEFTISFDDEAPDMCPYCSSGIEEVAEESK
jgi:DNA-directed RNA polymerase subunit RPC12/RpoP